MSVSVKTDSVSAAADSAPATAGQVEKPAVVGATESSADGYIEVAEDRAAANIPQEVFEESDYA